MGLCHGKPSPSLQIESSLNLSENDSSDQLLSNPATPKVPKFPFYIPSPQTGSYKNSPTNSSLGSMLLQIFMRRFLPPSPAKHIKAFFAWRHGSDMLNESSILEGSEVELRWDKSFILSEGFAEKYELGEEVRRGNFRYTSSTKVKKRELKGEEGVVKLIPKAKMTTTIAIEDVRREVRIMSALTGHKNLGQFYDAYEDDENVYIVMEILFLVRRMKILL